MPLINLHLFVDLTSVSSLDNKLCYNILELNISINVNRSQYGHTVYGSKDFRVKDLVFYYFASIVHFIHP